MKQTAILLIMIFCTSFLFAEATDLFFSEYIEGSSYNKALEIFNGTGETVDLTQYQLWQISNDGYWYEYTIDFPEGSTLADGEVYVICHSDADPAMIAVADLVVTLYHNGNDAQGLAKSDGAGGFFLIDTIGQEEENGVAPAVGWDVAGVTNATANHTIVRKPIIDSPTTDWPLSAGTNSEDSQWFVYDQNTFSYLGYHEFSGGEDPVILVISPNGGEEWETGSTHNISWTSSNFDGLVTIEWMLPVREILVESTANDGSWEWNIPVDQPVSDEYLIAIYDADDGDPYDQSNAFFSIVEPPTVIDVATIAELRTSYPDDDIYRLTGEAILTFKQDFRGQKYIQDATAAILIDDDDGIIETEYQLGDGIINLTGNIIEYGGMLQFVPTVDDGIINSTGNQITPEIVTLEQISTDFEEYEAELIKVLAVDFTDTGTFQTGQVYEVTDASRATGNFRTTFYDADYIDTAIPSISVNLTVICNSRSDGEFITSRSLADIEPASGDETITVLIPNGGEMWYQGTSQTISWASYNFTGDVIIELLQNGSNPAVLISSTENDGYWSWDIPTDLPVADTYSIRVSDVDDGDPADESDAYFSILEQVPQPDQGDVIITEIIQNPAAVADDAGEWFELYNTTGIAIDIDGWIIRDADNDEHIITNNAPLIIMPYDYLVLGINADEQTNGGVLVDYQYSTFTLANGVDEVILFWVDGTTEIDRVEYDDGVTFPDPNGASMALNPYFMNYEDNDLGANWYTSYTVYGDGDMGTPGEENPEPPLYPEAPSSPQPADGSTGIDIDPILTWINGNFTQTIDLYFGTEDPPATMVLDNVTAVETYTPETLLENTTYYWQVICRNSFGDTQGDIWNFTTESSAWEENQIPDITRLLGNYPNPFNPSTTINFSLAENTKITLDILDIRGNIVATIVNDYFTADSYSLTWTGVNNKGEKVPSGVYLYRLKTADSSQVRKMLLLK